MAVYKVPQDVEADDKLIGPFSFRQFIYLIVVAISGGIAWGLFMLFPLLVIIPIPVMIFFGALALPLKKDQPMEIYLAAVLSFYLKPRRRLWAADGVQSLVEITAPRVVENRLTKDLSQTEAQKRLSYLADIADTQGWSVRGVSAPESSGSLNEDFYSEAREATDVLDESTEVARAFESRLDQANTNRRETMLENLHKTAASAETVAASDDVAAQKADSKPSSNTDTVSNDEPEPRVEINPYPASIHQSTIQPISRDKSTTKSAPERSLTPTTQDPTSTSVKGPSPDIINLATNSPDLSIDSIAHQAKRISDREAALPVEEVVVPLR